MNDVQEKVMQANGIDRNKAPDHQLRTIQAMIQRERRWFLFTKLLTGFFWLASLVVLGCYMVTVKHHLFEMRETIGDSRMSDTVSIVVALETILPGVIIVATVCSVFLYIRAKSVNLLQVHERLHNLEEMVKVLLSR